MGAQYSKLLFEPIVLLGRYGMTNRPVVADLSLVLPGTVEEQDGKIDNPVQLRGSTCTTVHRVYHVYYLTCPNDIIINLYYGNYLLESCN